MSDDGVETEQAVSQHQERDVRLDIIRARIRRSLDDPRPSLSAEEAEAEMNRFMDARAKAFLDNGEAIVVETD